MADVTDSPAEKEAFESRLESGKERFLAHCIEHALATGRRNPKDFIRHFPPTAIMQGLGEQPKLRSSILVMTTGLKPSIAEKKSWESAGEDLQIALDEGETNAEAVVELFLPDDRVRYLDADKIWSFLIEGDYWTVSLVDRAAHALAKDNVAFVLERALVDNLVSHREVVEGITVAELSNRLPKAELGRIIEAALQKAKQGTPFTELDLLTALPPKVLVEHVPLTKIWNCVVEPLAERHGYVKRPQPAEPEPAAAESSTPGEAPAATEERAPSERPAAAAEAAEQPAPDASKPSDEEPGSTETWITVSESGAPPPDDDDVVTDDDFATS
jgi:hypothetical protein